MINMKKLEDISKKYQAYKKSCENLEKKLQPFLINSCENFHINIMADEGESLMIIVDNGELPLRYNLTEELINDIIKLNEFPYKKYENVGV